MGKFMQYELWKDCTNHCRFCYNHGQLDKFSKIASLQFFLKKLDDPEMDNYNEIGFIGGEFFDEQIKDPDVKALFYKLFEKCAEKYKAGKLNRVYLMTALMFKPEKYLLPFLDYLRELDILKITLLCTSYDLKYRFRTEQRKLYWENNMHLLHEKYPEMPLHTEMIMTEFFMQAVLNNEFSITDFHNKYHTWIDYVHPQRWVSNLSKEECIKILPDFFAKKDTFVKFIKKTGIENNEIDLNTFLSMNVRSDAFYCVYNGKDIAVKNRRDLLESDKQALNAYCEEHEDLKEYLQEKSESGFVDSDLQMHDVVNQIRMMYGDY